jgi:hypothetical protein
MSKSKNTHKLKAQKLKSSKAQKLKSSKAQMSIKLNVEV